MSRSDEAEDQSCERLRSRIAISILIDEQVIAALAQAMVLLRETDDPAVSDLEQAIRAHRIGILKQRAILGAAGVKV
jgi:hypothetical protein